MLRVTQLIGFGSKEDDKLSVLYPASGSWVDSMSMSFGGGGALGYYGTTTRQIIAGLLSVSGPKVRLVLAPSTGLGGSGAFNIDTLYIGEQATSGDPYDMKASAPLPMQFFVNGSGVFSTSAEQLVITDELVFAIDKTKTYVISTHFMDHSVGESDLGLATITGATNYTKHGVNEAGVADASSSGYFSDGSGSLRMITKVQVFVGIDTDVFYTPTFG